MIFYELVDRAFHDQIINQTTWEFIRTQHPRLATFYCLPKTHKNGQHLTGRPIVSGNGTLTENASQLIDATLRPHVATLPSCIKDTISFLKAIDDFIILTSALLVRIDVECLYNSIPHSKSIKEVKYFFYLK